MSRDCSPKWQPPSPELRDTGSRMKLMAFAPPAIGSPPAGEPPPLRCGADLETAFCCDSSVFIWGLRTPSESYAQTTAVSYHPAVERPLMPACLTGGVTLHLTICSGIPLSRLYRPPMSPVQRRRQNHRCRGWPVLAQLLNQRLQGSHARQRRPKHERFRARHMVALADLF